jgi:hypothetical protein
MRSRFVLFHELGLVRGHATSAVIPLLASMMTDVVALGYSPSGLRPVQMELVVLTKGICSPNHVCPHFEAYSYFLRFMFLFNLQVAKSTC